MTGKLVLWREILRLLTIRGPYDEEEFATMQGAVANQNQELPETTEITLPKLQLGMARAFTFPLRSRTYCRGRS